MDIPKKERLEILDQLLQKGSYTTSQLHDLVNKELDEKDRPKVTLRVIQKDLKEMSERYHAPINFDGRFRSYTEDFTLFPEIMSEKEHQLIYEVLKTLGQFDGLKSFEWIQTYMIGLQAEERKPILSFTSTAELKGTKWLPCLFEVISNKQVINVSYRPFGGKTNDYIIHPYLLKEYNGRWYLIGAIDKDDFIINFAIDRIKDYRIMDKIAYREYSDGDINDRYKDLVGITLRKESKMEHIIIWVDDVTFNYVNTKHITRFQTNITGFEEQKLRDQYPQLETGHFIDLYTYVCELTGTPDDKFKNYELVRELSSYAGGLLVLSPEYLQNQIFEKISAHKERYSKIRT